MMKWNAFNALLAHGSSVNKMMLERKRIKKPVLSVDQIEDLNIKITEAVEDGRSIQVAFYKSGYVLLVEGKILRLDLINRLIVFPEVKVRLDDILQIEYSE